MLKEKFHHRTTIPYFPDDRVPIPVPAQIGPYKIESLLNKGGMSVLYMGTNPETSNPLVVKVLSPRYLKYKEPMDRFLKEAEIIKMTNHPNIVQLYGQGKWEKGFYIAMEFIQGISLRQFILQKSLSQKRALEIILQVGYALCHLHSHGVIHRDLKPENIIITETGQIKVIDFGIAQVKEEIKEERITQNKRMMGTPIYMSPEQKEDPKSVSYSSDIYSLGIITYELVLGRLSHGVIHLSLLNNGLRRIVDKALKLDPKERYQDIVDFITDVSEYMKSADEESEEETFDEILTQLSRTQNAFLPKKDLKWPPVEIGVAVQEGLILTGLYSDFFKLPENRYAVILAEPIESGMESLLYTSTLRGMVRMIINQSFNNIKKDQHPITVLNSINRVLFEDPMKQKFAFNLLILNPDKDQLSFASCGYNELWHFPDGAKKGHTLSTPNAALGTDPNVTILETDDNWNPGDRLVLYSFGIATSDSSKEVKSDLKKVISNNLLLSPQSFSKKILRKMIKPRESKRGELVLSIHRIF